MNGFFVFFQHRSRFSVIDMLFHYPLHFILIHTPALLFGNLSRRAEG